MMKHSFLRRLGALTLALAMALTLMVAPAWAYNGNTSGLTVSADGKEIVAQGQSVPLLEMKVGETVTLSVKPTDVSDTTAYTYNWGIAPENSDEPIKFLDADGGQSTMRVSAIAVGTTNITVMTPITNDEFDEDNGGWGNLGILLAVKVTEADQTVDPTDPPATPTPDLVNPTGVTLSAPKTELELNETMPITAIFSPENARAVEIAWSSAPSGIVTVEKNQQGGYVVTPIKAGTTVIKATLLDPDDPSGRTTLKDKNGNEITANWSVTVKESTVPMTRIDLGIDRTLAPNAGVTTVAPTITPNTSTDSIVWESSDPTIVRAERNAGSTNGWIGALIGLKPGRVTITAYAVDAEGNRREGVSDAIEVEVTGIAIKPATVSLIEGGKAVTLSCESFGAAKTDKSTVYWSSSDPTIVSIANNTGNSCMITPLAVGTATIRATKGGYPVAECKVTVQEDTTSIVNVSGAFNSGSPLVIGNERVYGSVSGYMLSLPGALNYMSQQKTQTVDADGHVTAAGYGLSYISNVSVPTSQGTLYINYNSEANTGDGVGIADRFYYGTAPAGQATLSWLTFVPRQGFSGTAEITFNGVAQNNINFSGTIRVPVNGSGDGSGIYYGAVAGQPTTFLVDDFNAYCNAVTGRDLNYVVFSLPPATAGTLYYNYTSSASTGSRVSATTQYSRTGNTNIGRVSFVPSPSYLGDVTVNFRGVNTAGISFNGSVRITVGSSSMGLNSSDVSFTAQDGKQVTLRTSDFNNACQATIGETLSYVRFTPPASSEGVLYYNYRSGGSYDSRVDSNTRYYFSGVPSISDITFVAAANAGGQVAVPYIGYSSSGATYSGTMYINLQGDNQTTIRYAVNKNGLVGINANDFNNVCLRQTGYTMEYVTFQSLPSASMGTLYYNYRSSLNYNTRVSTGASYYRTYDSRYSSRYLLGNVTFLAGSTAGTVTIPYTIYTAASNNAGRKTVSGTMEILVGAPTPTDVNLSGRSASPVWLPSTSIRSACSAVMNGELSYIEITSVPDEKEGRVYSLYNGIGTGTEVVTGTRYYRAGSPSIDQLSFVPYGGFNGTAVITYIGYSSDGREQVSGQIKVTITNSTTSRYFNDMANHGWAADAVDFLYENNISNGVGGGRYSPGGTLTRGDFTLMLVRTFGFTSSQTYRFSDVPSTSYYASAISTAKALGITVGESGSNFYPKQAISRQDAMVMLYNALKASGNTLTNGLTADLTIFSDRGSIASYALNAVGTLVQMGVVKGDGNGRLRPTSSLSRAETAILLQYVLTL